MFQFHIKTLSIALLATSIVFCEQIIYAQTTKASITEVITDSSLAVVAGAKISAKDLNRGLLFTNTSNSSDLLPELPSGNYSLMAEAPGFRTYVLDRFPLQNPTEGQCGYRAPSRLNGRESGSNGIGSTS